MKGLCHLLPKTPDVLVVPVPISRITVYFAFPSLPHEYFCWLVPIIILWYYAPPAYCVPVSDRILVGFCNFLGFFFFLISHGKCHIKYHCRQLLWDHCDDGKCELSWICRTAYQFIPWSVGNDIKTAIYNSHKVWWANSRQKSPVACGLLLCASDSFPDEQGPSDCSSGHLHVPWCWWGIQMCINGIQTEWCIQNHKNWLWLSSDETLPCWKVC